MNQILALNNQSINLNLLKEINNEVMMVQMKIDEDS